MTTNTNLPAFTMINTGNAKVRPWAVMNYVDGAWQGTAKCEIIPNPIGGEPLCQVAETEGAEFDPFADHLKRCPKSGLHNPLKNQPRYMLYGELCMKLAHALGTKEIADYFAHLIYLTVGKSLTQCVGEVTVTRRFLENFAGDQVRYLANGMSSPGDRPGQQSHDYRFPYGPVVIVYPFNFPIEIPVLQMMGALFMGNSVIIKGDSKVSVVLQEFIRLALSLGLPPYDVALVHADRGPMERFITDNADTIRMLQFTGSSRAAKTLTQIMGGRIKVEDAGFDPKIYGPDFRKEYLDFVAAVADNDAYAASGQKCSATSISFVHENWYADLMPKLHELADKRDFGINTIGPVLTWTTKRMLDHCDALLEIPGAKLCWGGYRLRDDVDHHVPDIYGCIKPTAIAIPLNALKDPKQRELIFTEVFGPVQVFVPYGSHRLEEVIAACEAMRNHLTMAVVSNDPQFLDEVLGLTVNGTVYAGILARTTGAPQNHNFCPSNDPRAAGIGTREAIIQTWSANRTIIKDTGEYGKLPPVPVQS